MYDCVGGYQGNRIVDFGNKLGKKRMNNNEHIQTDRQTDRQTEVKGLTTTGHTLR